MQPRLSDSNAADRGSIDRLHYFDLQLGYTAGHGTPNITGRFTFGKRGTAQRSLVVRDESA
jgi:hypothetical protein